MTTAASLTGALGPEVQARHEQLVEQVKGNQRFSPVFKTAWRGYCDRYGRGFYDPARHPLQFIEEFFAAGLAPPESCQGGSCGPGGPLRGRSRSWRPREASSGNRSGSSESSHSRSRRRRKRRAKGSRRHRKHRKDHEHRHHRRGRRKRRRKSRRKRTSSSNGSECSWASGLPSRAAAIKSAEAAVSTATKALEVARKGAESEIAERLKEVEIQQKDEVAKKVVQSREEVEDTINPG